MIVERVREILVAEIDPARLARYAFQSGAPTAAIFTTLNLPDDATLPAILLREGADDFSTGLRAYEKGAVVHSAIVLRLHGNKNQNLAELRELGWDIWHVLSGRNLDSMEDEKFIVGQLSLTAPALIEDREGFPIVEMRGRVLVSAKGRNKP